MLLRVAKSALRTFASPGSAGGHGIRRGAASPLSTKKLSAGILPLTFALALGGCVAKDDASSAKGVSSSSGGSAPSGPLDLSFADGSNLNLGIVAAGSTRYVFLSVATLGNGSATVTGSSNSNSAYTFDGGVFPGTGGTCSSVILSNCSIAIKFTPSGLGPSTNTLSVSYNSNGATKSLSISLSATTLPPAVLTISDGVTYNYGTHVIGVATDKTFTVTNAGGLSATSLSGASLSAPFAYKGGSYPGTGGTCATTLASTDTCTVVVTYTPTAAVLSSGTLTLNYSNPSTTTSTARALQGTGQSGATLTISDGATYNFGSAVTNSTSKEKTFTVTNSGSITATAMSGAGLSAPYNFFGGIYPGTGGTCGTTLAAAGTCTIVVSFAPTSTGTFADTIELSYLNGATTLTALRPISGTGVLATVLTISDNPTWDFGSRTVGTTSEKTFVVTNSGPIAAATVTGTGLAAPFAFKGGSFPGTGGTCTATITTNCTIIVTYTPASAGLLSDTIQLNYDNGGGATSAYRDVQGTGLGVATLTISDANTYDYGLLTSGQTLDHTFTVTYTGQTAATAVNPGALIAPYSFKGGAYPGTGGTCSATISTNCTIVVTFSPVAGGTFNASLSLNFNDGAAAQSVSRAITGQAVTRATLTISDAPDYDYGTKAVSTVTLKSFTITNTGGTSASSIVPANLLTPFGYAGGTFPGTPGGTCGATLTPAGTCVVVVEFAPLSAGGYSETFGLQYNDGVTTKTVDRPITGTAGTVANLSISGGPTYGFGTVAVAYTADATLTVTNVGGSGATAINETNLAAPFAFKGGSFPGTGGTCTATLANAAACTLVVRYSPTTVANHARTLTLSYFNGNSTVTSTRGLSGTGASLVAVKAGKQNTCVLYSTGIIKCWGADNRGQLGNDATFATTLAPATVSNITNAIDLAVGHEHGCATLSNGRIDCWGSDTSGQLGNDGSFTDSGVPVTVATTTDFVQVAAGGELTCGRRSGGTVQCWGDDSQGGNGNGGLGSDNATPVSVSGLTASTDIAVGDGHACAVDTGDDPECWGRNDSGQVGVGTTLPNYAAVEVTDLSNVADRVYVGGTTSAIRRTNGAMYVFGDDASGQLGDGGGATDRTSPVTFAAMDNALDLAFGTSHGCGITAAGTVRCWGSDGFGQLGDNVGLANSFSPVTVSGIGTARAVGVGGQHSCAIANTGLVYCWGDNASGQLGTGSAGGHSATAIQVQGL